MSARVFPDSNQPHCPRLKPSLSLILASGPPTFDAILTRSRPPLITSSKPLSLRRPFLSGGDSCISLPPRRSILLFYLLFRCTCLGILLARLHQVTASSLLLSLPLISVPLSTSSIIPFGFFLILLLPRERRLFSFMALSIPLLLSPSSFPSSRRSSILNLY